MSLFVEKLPEEKYLEYKMICNSVERSYVLLEDSDIIGYIKLDNSDDYVSCRHVDDGTVFLHSICGRRGHSRYKKVIANLVTVYMENDILRHIEHYNKFTKWIWEKWLRYV